MADNTNMQKSPSVSSEDLNALLELAHTLETNIANAKSSYMRSIYIRLRAEVSKELRRSRAAQEREIMASYRRSIRAMKASAKDTNQKA